MNMLAPTPGQTVGPFFGYALPFPHDSELTPNGSVGSLSIHGTVTDGDGQPIPDAILEIWQADEHGAIVQQAGSMRRDGYTFTGWGRASTGNEGNYHFSTREPGTVDEGKPRFIAVMVLARGLMNKLHTRLYLPEDEALFAGDRLLSELPEDRRQTLIAAREADGSLRFDIRLQGEGETVFLSFSDEAAR